MTSLSGKDDGGDGGVFGGGDVLSGTSIGRDTDVLDHGGEADEGGDIGVRANER